LTAPPPDGADPTRATVSRADGLRRGLRVTFGLGDRELTSEEMVAPSTIEKLTPVYYNINDWICSAFTILLRDLEGTSPTVRAAIRHREAALLKNEGGAAPYDQIPLEDFDVETLAQLGGAGGKALFLETMGFGSAEIWGGDPRAPRSVDALRSYGGRLRERHHVIARLAREGVVPLIITTNFDLLLEGACREAGFEIGDPGETDPAKPWAGYDRLLVVAGPTEFVERGNPYRAASLLKIHGCVFRYREERRAGVAALDRYLASMVFTYREIQNWRKDSWSRDLVSTLLRTRTIVLCGYSGADPVVHDTFRTVYEEILAQRPPSAADGSPRPAGLEQDARAFFTGEAGKAEFAGTEILRAGSRAAGFVDPPLYGHPNYLPFHYYGRQGADGPFPTLDEVFTWIYHRALRRMQASAIRSDLRRIAAMLLHRNVAPADIDDIARMFATQCERENTLARGWDTTERSRLEFRQVTAWTNDFHVALLREFALMETVVRDRRASLRIQDFRSRGYYFPLLDRPGWGAWGAVVEMALRRMAGLDEGRTADAGRSRYPVALVRPRRTDYTMTAVVLRGPGTDRVVADEIPGHYRRVHEWQLMHWLPERAIPRGTPGPEDIWCWAFEASLPSADAPGAWFGEADERHVCDTPAALRNAHQRPV